MTEWCDWCRLDPPVFRNGLCRACHAYARKYGRCPAAGIIEKRIVRRRGENGRGSAWRDETGQWIRSSSVETVSVDPAALKLLPGTYRGL